MLQVLMQKQYFEKNLGQAHLLTLESLPESQEVTEMPLGLWKLVAAILGNSFYHEDTDNSKQYFGILPLAY